MLPQTGGCGNWMKGTMRPIHWGVVGTGRMAAALTEAIASLAPQEARVIGVASRERHKAASFASRHGIARACEGLDELLAIAELDAVYIATPHTEHHRGMLAAIAARKAVLCEKPFTINAMQASEVIEAARAAGVFVMEAMWTRFLPSLIALRESLAAGISTLASAASLPAALAHRRGCSGSRSPHRSSRAHRKALVRRQRPCRAMAGIERGRSIQWSRFSLKARNPTGFSRKPIRRIRQ